MQHHRGREDDGTLSDDVAATRAAVDQNGCVTIIMPKDAADDLGIEPGESVFWTGREGDDSLEVGPLDADELLAD